MLNVSIPIYRTVVDGQLQYLAYLKPMFVNMSYPDRHPLFDFIDSNIQERRTENDYVTSSLKLMYQHYSDKEFYVWSKDSVVSFEPSLDHKFVKDLTNNIGFTFSIDFQINEEETPNIFWEIPN